jgi:hypothetical protein
MQTQTLSTSCDGKSVKVMLRAPGPDRIQSESKPESKSLAMTMKIDYDSTFQVLF